MEKNELSHNKYEHAKIEKMFQMISQMVTGPQENDSLHTTDTHKSKNIAVLLHTLFTQLCTTLPKTSSQWITK